MTDLTFAIILVFTVVFLAVLCALAFRPTVEDPPPASWISKMEGRE